MPLIDKPLDELKVYQGRNPRPADFDAYWDQSLRELDAHDPQVTLTPHQGLPLKNAEAFDLEFTGIGGSRVYAKYLRPKRLTAPAPGIVAFHGYSGSSGDWTNYLGYVGEGFAVAALDVRGQAGRSQETLQTYGPTLRGHIIRGLDDPDPMKLLYRHIFLDTALLARIVMAFDEVDASRVASIGGSQGGALAIACAALEPRIRLTTPRFPFLCDYRRIYEMDLFKDAYQELRDFFRNFDPLHRREEEIFTRLGYIDIQFLAPRIKADVLFTVGLMDTVCPPSSQFAVYNKISSPKQLLIYPDFGHEGLPGCPDEEFTFISKLNQ